MRRAILTISLLAFSVLPTPVWAQSTESEPQPSGYGRFAWGTPASTIKKQIKGMKTFAQAEPVLSEKKALSRLYAEAKAQAKAKGKKAYRTFKKQPKPQGRISATRHWLKFNGLAGRVQMHFFDGELFEVNVHILYRRKDKKGAGQILSTLIEKYGEPTPPEDELAAKVPISKRMSLHFEMKDGDLHVLRSRARKKTRGMIRLRYRSDSLGLEVEEHLSALTDEVQILDEALAKAKKKKAAAKLTGKERLWNQL